MNDPLIGFEQLWLPPAERQPTTALNLLRAPEVPASTILTPPEIRHHAKALVGTVAKAAVEALTGYRPFSQLSRWLEPDAISGLSLAARHAAWAEARVSHVRAIPVSDDSIEGVAQVTARQRRLAITICLKRRQASWACSHLAVLLPGSHLISRP